MYNETYVNKLSFKAVILLTYDIMLQQVTRQKGALPCTETFASGTLEVGVLRGAAAPPVGEGL